MSATRQEKEEKMTTYPSAVKLIAELAQINIRMHKELAQETISAGKALANVTEMLYQDKYDARHRLGKFRFSMTSEEKYQADFLAMVAYDAELGNVERPSVGNVRNAVLTEIESNIA